MKQKSIEQQILQVLQEIKETLNESKEIWRIGDVAKFSGLSFSSIYKLTSGRAIPFYKKGRHLYFKREEIMNWVTRNQYQELI